MLEKYYKYKIKYKEFIVLIKFGNFYEIFDNDALIFNKLFNYKVNRLKNTFKAGFPISKLDSIIYLLNNKNINYVVINNDDIVSINEFDNNNYNKYNFDKDLINYNIVMIDNIISYLNDNILNSEIYEKLNKIEEIINE